MEPPLTDKIGLMLSMEPSVAVAGLIRPPAFKYFKSSTIIYMEASFLAKVSVFLISIRSFSASTKALASKTACFKETEIL